MELRPEAKLLAGGAWLDFNLYTQSVVLGYKFVEAGQPWDSGC